MNSEKEDEPLEEIGDSNNVLDLTSYQLHSLDTVELPPNLIELDLTANRLSGLDSRIAQLSTLKKLSLRQNLIDDSAVEPLSHWDALSDLEVILDSLIYLLSDFVNGEISRHLILFLAVERYDFG
jgi:protein phosphatase 1 regulatory subunit 7